MRALPIPQSIGWFIKARILPSKLEVLTLKIGKSESDFIFEFIKIWINKIIFKVLINIVDTYIVKLDLIIKNTF